MIPNDKEIKEAVEILKHTTLFREATHYEKPIQSLLDLAQAYLDVKCPEKKEIGEMRHGGCNPDYDRGWNDAIDDYRILVLKQIKHL